MTRRRWALLAAAIAAVVAFAAFVFLRDEPGLSPVESASFEVGDAPLDVDVGAEVWVANGASGTLSHFPPEDPSAAEEIEVGGRPSQLALGRGSVWIAYPVGDAVASVSEETAEVTKDIRVGRTPAAVAADETGAYFTALDSGSIWRVEEDQGRELAGLDDGFPSSVAIGFGSLWVTDVVADQLLRVDPATGDVVARIDVGTAPTAVAVGTDAVWVANFNDATVSRIDPATDEMSGDAVILGGKPGALAVGFGYVWVTRSKDDSVIRIDTTTNEWTGEVFRAGDNPTGIAVGAGHVWVTNTGDDTITRLTPGD
jgi:DNA-binding beta-propeller fold protein YncE